MRRDVSSRQSRWVELVEEETKVRKNLSRLIHTVQHMPSARYRRDASTLSNLVGELESFQPPSASKSTNYSKKTTRKSFSRKYLDLRLYPSRDRSSSPDCNLRNKTESKNPQTFNKNSNKKNNKTETKNKEPDRNVKLNSFQDKIPFVKTQPERNKNCKSKVLPENNKGKIINYPECQTNSELKGLQVKPRSKQLNYQTRKKSEGTNVSNQNFSSEKFHRDKMNLSPNQESNSLSNDTGHKYQVLDKIKRLKNSDYTKEKSNLYNRFDETLRAACSKECLFEKNQASMVKKLTSYWNNLLNKEVDDTELSSSHESSDDPIDKSLQDLARSVYHKTRERQRRLSMSRRRSESSINDMKKCDDFNDISPNHKMNSDDFFESLSEILSNRDLSNHIKSKKSLHLKEESRSYEKLVPTNPYLLGMYCDKSCGDNENLDALQNGRVEEVVEPNFNLTAQHAIDVMETLVRKLKRFCKLPLTSDEITLSHSLRAMLCLMTANVIASGEPGFELGVEVESAEDEEIDGKVNLFLSSSQKNHTDSRAESNDVPLIEKVECNNNCNINGKNDNLEIVAVDGLTMRKVEDAMRYLTLCKDYLWTEFLWSPMFNEEGLYNEDSNIRSPHSFTFIFEEEIILEDDPGEDKSCSEDESEEEIDESTMVEVCNSMFDCFSISFERLTELVADMILHYWPDSVRGFVNAMYQTLVSLLVWWVIMKEIFNK